MTVIPLLAGWLIMTLGWRHSYLVIGMVALVSIPLLAQFLVRDPAQKGLKPYGSENGDGAPISLADSGVSLAKALKTGQLWIVCSIYVLVSFSTQTVMVHLAPHASDLGASPAQAAVIVSIMGALSMAGRVVMGLTGDRLGQRRAITIILVVLVVALIWLRFLTYPSSDGAPR